MPKSLSVRLDLRSAADFRMNVPYRYKRVVAGTSATFNVGVDRLDSYGNDVNLTYSDLPSGATASYDDSELSVGESAVMTVGTAGVTAGKHNFYVTGAQAPAEGNTVPAASPSLADVQAAIALASPGDMVIVPAGDAEWSTYLNITKGIDLIAAGIGLTNITLAGTWGIAVQPSSGWRATQEMLGISGFTFKGAPATGTIYFGESNSETVPMRNIRVHHNRLETTTGYPIYVDGNFWGCVDNNQFAGKNFFMVLGNQDTNWANLFPPVFGTADNLYYEDNVFDGPYAFGFQSGQGGRWALRYNAITPDAAENPLHDQHGLQSVLSGVYALMMCEIYENTYGGAMTPNRWNYQRGGQLLMYNNTGSTSGGSFGISVEDSRWDDGTGKPGIAPPSYLSYQTPHNDYFWNNVWNGTRQDAHISHGATQWDGTEYEELFENISFFNQQTSFDGSAGMGVGLISARPSSGLTVGVGYWATDTSTLYRATGATTWETYYTPYTYPHPLRA